MKILKSKFFSSTIILILSGFVTKIMGLIIKIIFTRIAPAKSLALYTLVMPTYSLLLTITTFAMPTTIAKLVSEKQDVKVLNSATIIILFINFFIIFFMFVFSPFLAEFLLNDINAYPILIACSLTLPNASLACILKGYFYGKEKMVPHVVSNTVEQIIRLLLIVFIMPILIRKSYVYAAIGLVLTSFVTEAASIIVFLTFMKKKDVIVLKNLSIRKEDINDIFTISVPTVSSRIFGNICYFFEPIIITNLLLLNGYSLEYIELEYGYYNAYAISTLTIPSFFINAISLVLLPEVSKLITKYCYKDAFKKLKYAIIYSLIIGTCFTTVIYLFRYPILNLMYNSIKGVNYIKILAPFFILFYLEAIFTSFLQGLGKSKKILKITIISSLIKEFSLCILCFFHLGMNALVISEIINIIFAVLLDYKEIKASKKALLKSLN